MTFDVSHDPQKSLSSIAHDHTRFHNSLSYIGQCTITEILALIYKLQLLHDGK